MSLTNAVIVCLVLVAVVVVGWMIWLRERERMAWLIELDREQRVRDAARIQDQLGSGAAGEELGDRPVEVSVRELLQQTGGVRDEHGQFQPPPTLEQVVRSARGKAPPLNNKEGTDGDPKS